jgi:putative spermidine/putrescine transport system permease protein
MATGDLIVAPETLSPPVGPPAPRRRGVRRAGEWTGVMPFALYVLVFLGLPLYMVLKGSFTTDAGGFTFSNFSQTFSQPQYSAAFKQSIELSVWTALAGAIFGIWLAAAVLTARPNSPLRRIVSSASGVLAYFAGVPLAFAFIAALGQTGVATILLKNAGINLYSSGFSIASITGIGLAYVYFQIPLMVILITPALEGLRPQWHEAAQSLGASQWAYLRHVAIPVLAPAVIGATLILFGNAFSAYATALALVNGTVPLVPSQIQAALSGNVLVNQDHIGLALGVEMVVVITIVMVGYGLVQRRARRWLQ